MRFMHSLGSGTSHWEEDQCFLEGWHLSEQSPAGCCDKQGTDSGVTDLQPAVSHTVLWAVGIASTCDVPLKQNAKCALTQRGSSMICLLDKVRTFLVLHTFRTLDIFFFFQKDFTLFFSPVIILDKTFIRKRLFRYRIKLLVKLGWEIQTSRLSL